MAKRQQDAKGIFSQFKSLSWEHQVEFLELAQWEDGDNPIKRMMALLDDAGLDIAKAMSDALIADMQLDRMKRKPNIDLGREIVRLHDNEGLSFGQIGKQLKPPKKYEAVRKLYSRTKVRLAAGR